MIRSMLAVKTMMIMSAVAAMATVAVAGAAGLQSANAATGYVIENDASFACLDVQGASQADGAYIVTRPCSGNTSQEWRAVASVVLYQYSDPITYYQYQNAHSGLCIGVSGSSASSGARLVQGQCSGTSDHSQFWNNAWQINANGGKTGKYWFVNGHSGLYMDLEGDPQGYGQYDYVAQGGYSAYNPGQLWYTQ